MKKRQKNKKKAARHFYLTIGILILVLVLFLLARKGAQGVLPVSTVVTDVIDGDTIEILGGLRVRLLGIDTPELRVRDDTSPDGWRFSPQPGALEAKEALKRLVLGKRVNLVYGAEKKDRYNRLLAYCFVNDVFVNYHLVKEGLAALLILQPKSPQNKSLCQAAQSAICAGKGIWASEANDAIKNPTGCAGRICYVSGRVLDVVYTGKYKHIILQKEPVLFYVSIPSYLLFYDNQYRREFAPGDIVFAFGKVRKEGRNGFSLRIRGPCQLLEPKCDE